MSLTLSIPDNVLYAIKLPKSQIEHELTQEIAFALYERGLTSMGMARQFANLSKWAFIDGLAKRGIKRHYEEDEINEDIAYANLK
ncbi:conserved hypothetical protein [Beggiatoa sp. PS]|nr:conserved hypothetical protein [Beggiatoa sp. PS]